ncbi:GTPase Der [Porphyromonas levii]|uniref:GTPase n=1 Tax=Porphyromonas levii TaxID=28114 RepID=UPI001B8B9B00|nr:GTPase [Porphyromonas levii]MBR8769693.1 GTPase Der [Porphyromonas levii]MBR8783986.1 GTPase Der [Porphyromonas levii]
MAHVNYAICQETLSSLIEKTRDLLLRTNNQDLLLKLDDELDAATNRKKLSIAFVGQYSSGKSTIISALTGNKNIKIDANVSTDTVSKYDWHDIILMDTPGILAGKLERHDETTKESLKESDLIFYVLTSQLFDDVVFNNFIDLAYNQHLADKIFIVVNKMSMEAGTYDELVENYLSSLRQTFSDRGYCVDDFPIAFIDANDYIEGVEGRDNDFIELSHFEHFINMLNAFVDKKGIIKKQFDTPVRILQGYLKNIEVSTVDKNLSALYNQIEQKLTSSQKEIKRDVNQVLYSFDSLSMNEVVNLSNEIGYIEEDDFRRRESNLNQELEQKISETAVKIEKVINQSYDLLVKEINEFSGKEALVRYEKDLDRKIDSPTISIEEKKSLEKQRECLRYLSKGATKVSEMAPGVTSLTSGISKASGSTLHNIVKSVGHFFGKSFKPWQAVRWASNIAKFAKFGMPIVTTGFDIWMQCREDKKENKRLEQIKVAKDQFRTCYQGEINKVKELFESYLNSVIENFVNKRNEINQSKDELIKTSKRNDEISKLIKELEGEYVDFIEIIDGNEILVNANN